jgi:hypothetical protein
VSTDLHGTLPRHLTWGVSPASSPIGFRHFKPFWFSILIPPNVNDEHCVVVPTERSHSRAICCWIAHSRRRVPPALTPCLECSCDCPLQALFANSQKGKRLVIGGWRIKPALGHYFVIHFTNLVIITFPPVGNEADFTRWARSRRAAAGVQGTGGALDAREVSRDTPPRSPEASSGAGCPAATPSVWGIIPPPGCL